MRCARLVAPVGAALMLGMLLPATSSAAVTCSYNGGPRHLEVFVSSPARIVRKASNIEVYEPSGGGSSSVACSPGGATVDNTEAVIVFNQAPANAFYTVTIDLVGGPFAPGFTNETGTNDEIEFQLESIPRLEFEGTPGVENMRFGADGANLNAGQESALLAPGRDVDATIFGSDSVHVRARGDNDRIGGQGGLATGGPFPVPMTIFGEAGDDQLTGGDGDDSIGFAGLTSDEAGDDTLGGGAGADRISAAPGNDTITGGAGEDLLTYFNAPSGLSVDLAVSGPQETGGGGLDSYASVESIFGSLFDDALFGDAASNSLTGGTGNDTLDGRGGVDSLLGDGPVAPYGSDVLFSRDGGPDNVSCGPEVDSLTADAAGTDTIADDCETVDFGVFTGPPDGGGDGGADSTVDVTISARKRQKAADRRALTVRARCPGEDCEATTRAKIRLPGRSAKSRMARTVVKSRVVTERLSAGVAEKLRLRLPKPAVKRVRGALEQRNRLPAVVRIAATDAAGNRGTASVKVKVVD